MREQEEALMRENEESQRLEDEAQQRQLQNKYAGATDARADSYAVSTTTHSTTSTKESHPAGIQPPDAGETDGIAMKTEVMIH